MSTLKDWVRAEQISAVAERTGEGWTISAPAQQLEFLFYLQFFSPQKFVVDRPDSGSLTLLNLDFTGVIRKSGYSSIQKGR